MDTKDFLEDNGIEKEQIKATDLSEVRDEIKKTEDNDKPFLAMDEGQLYVAGDPNKTETAKDTYEVEFEFPLTWKDRLPNAIKKDNELVVKTTLKEAYSTPRKRIRLVQAFGQVLTYLTKIDENGELEYGTTDYYAYLLSEMSNEVADAFYDLVAIFLGVKDEYKYRMSVDSVMRNVKKITAKNPRPSK